MSTATKRNPWPAYGYTAYGRKFQIDDLTDGTWIVTVFDYKTGAVLEMTEAADRQAAFSQVHAFENAAAATGAKR